MNFAKFHKISDFQEIHDFELEFCPVPETMKSLRNIDGLGGHFAPKRIFREKSGISPIFMKFHENGEFS